jgi:hypothetical protein
MNTSDLVTFVQNVEETGSDADLRVLRDLIWLALCRVTYTERGKVNERIALRHEWAQLNKRLGE